MKPSKAASGVRNSWLALAMKSARISSTRRSGVRSLKVISSRSEGPPSPPASRTGRTKASYQRSRGTRSKNSTRCGSRLLLARRMALTSSGMRRLMSAGSPRRMAGASPSAAWLKAITRPSRSSTMAGPGRPAISDSIMRAAGWSAARRLSATTLTALVIPRGAAQDLPGLAQTGGKTGADRKIRRVVVGRHGQSALVFSASISLRIGCVTLTIRACGGSGKAGALRVLSQNSRMPRMTSATTKGQR